MKKIGLSIISLSVAALMCQDANAVLGPEALRFMLRNNTNTANLAIDVTNPGANALVGYDASSTLGRIDGGTGSFQIFLLGSGLNYNSGTSTLSVNFGGTTSQYVRGDGSLATFPTGGTRTFSSPSRSLNSCFQIDTSKDADFHYGVDVSTGLSLTSGAQGTVTATSYTNSSCTTGAVVESEGTAGQSGTLVVGIAVNQVVTVGLDGTLQGGKWMKITTANTSGTPNFSIRSNQREIILP